MDLNLHTCVLEKDVPAPSDSDCIMDIIISMIHSYPVGSTAKVDLLHHFKAFDLVDHNVLKTKTCYLWN